MVEVFPAKNGDCFLLHTTEGAILIDCGYVSTYSNYLKPALIKLASEDKKILRLIITHIDEDHIKGAIAFLKENGPADNPSIIRIDQIWHNGYVHLNSYRPSQKISKLSENLLLSTFTGIEEETDKLISAHQGSTLASLIVENRYRWNSDFGGKAVSVENGPEVEIADKISLSILSPNKPSLEKLEKYWRKELYRIGFREPISDETIFNDAFEFLLMRGKELPIPIAKKISSSFDINELMNVTYDEDKSPTNGSSIAFIICYEERRLLFLGDSHPTPICEALEAKRMDKSKPLYFDLIKISHHGAIPNSSKSFFEITNSENYLISTDGKAHPHPSKETLAWIIGRNNRQKKQTIYFNYQNAGYDLLQNESLKAEWSFETRLVDTPENRIINLKTNEVHS